MSSTQERIEQLERDLIANPPRISAYHDLPFAIFHYAPRSEFEIRQLIALLATRLENQNKRVRFVSLAKLLWQAIDETEGLEAIVRQEEVMGFERAQETISTILSDEDFFPLVPNLLKHYEGLDSQKHVVFLVRAGALAPALYRCAKLLDELHGKTMVPTILFYPGTLEGTTSLRFMGIPEREQTGAYNYRVRIY